MSHEPLSAEDATLLFVSDPEAQLQIGAVCFLRRRPCGMRSATFGSARFGLTLMPGWTSRPDFASGLPRSP